MKCCSGSTATIFVSTILGKSLVQSRCRVLSSSRQDEQTVLMWDNCRGSRMTERWLFFSSKRDPVLPYKTEKAEVHPNPVGNGQSTIEFFRNSFAMTGREVGEHLFDSMYGWRILYLDTLLTPCQRWSPWWELTPLASPTSRSACSPTLGPGLRPCDKQS